MRVADMFQKKPEPPEAVIYRELHDEFAALEQESWRQFNDEAGIEAGDIVRLLTRAYHAECDNPEEGDCVARFHELSLPRWRTFPIGAAR